MSRIGKIPVTIPAGVKTVMEGGFVKVEGPKGKLQFRPGNGIKVVAEDGKFVVSVDHATDNSAADYGTCRAVLNNMVHGVTKGWVRKLEMNGVGFQAKLAGQKLTLSCGYSHDVDVVLPAGIKCAVTKTTIELESADRELVGSYAAKIRKVQPPEPYLGKGIKYAEEVVRRKAGKTGKK